MAINNPSASQSPTLGGTAVISDGSTFVDIALPVAVSSYTPVVAIQGVGLIWFVTNVTSTGFRVNVVSAPTSNTTIYWSVIPR
jgi:hypothetical protein